MNYRHDMGKVIKTHAGHDLARAVREGVDALGGLGQFVRPGQTVLLKPNFNTADPFPASSSPDFISEVADMFHAHGAEVIIGESSTFRLDTSKVMEEWGLGIISRSRPWLKVIDFDKETWVRKAVPGGKALKHVSTPAVLDEVDHLILLPCLKTHFLARYTGALKLSVALMKPRERIALHARRLEEKIGEMNAVIRPKLVIMDARKCFITKGPSFGEVREPGLILTSTDRIAMDVEGVRIIQGFEGNTLADIEPEELTQIATAKAMISEA